MPDLIAGTYPYHQRHAIMDAVQAGLLPHVRLRGDDHHQGCVTVIVRVTAPPMHEPTPEQARGCATKVL